MSDFEDAIHSAFLQSQFKTWRELLGARNREIVQFMATPQFELQCKAAANTEASNARESAIQGAVTFPCIAVIVSPDDKLKFAPSLLVGSFEPTMEAIWACYKVAGELRSLYGPDKKASSLLQGELKKIIDDDVYVPMKRTLVPREATNGVEVFAFSALIYREKKDGDIVTILTRPGATPAPLLHIPDAVMLGGQIPSGVEVFYKRQSVATRNVQQLGTVLKWGIILGLIFLLAKCVKKEPGEEREESVSERVFSRAWERTKNDMKEKQREADEKRAK